MKILNVVCVFLFLIAPGVATVGLSTHWGINDFVQLVKADEQLQTSDTTGPQTQVLIYRATSHRINVFAEGTWLLMGIVMTGLGLHYLTWGSRK